MTEPLPTTSARRSPSHTYQGAAYVFGVNGSSWVQQAELTASDGARGDQFGFSVEIAGNTAVVAAPYNAVGGNANEGAAYAFTRSGTSWVQQAKLTESNGAVWDDLGLSVAMTGNTAVVGAPGQNQVRAPWTPSPTYRRRRPPPSRAHGPSHSSGCSASPAPRRRAAGPLGKGLLL